jgi:hypothetical protein
MHFFVIPKHCTVCSQSLLPILNIQYLIPKHMQICIILQIVYMWFSPPQRRKHQSLVYSKPVTYFYPGTGTQGFVTVRCFRFSWRYCQDSSLLGCSVSLGEGFLTFRNVGNLSTRMTASYSRRFESSFILIFAVRPF